MNETPISTLTQEISFAVFRVASLVDHMYLKKELERAAVEVAAYLDEESLNRLERLVSLGASVGEINTTNSAVLIREIGNLRDMLNLDEYEDEIDEEVDISSIFTPKGNQLPFTRQEATSTRQSSDKAGPSTRQKEILHFLRQFPNGCGFSDLARNFDEVSKRTIRNDVSSLIEMDLLERVGKSGPHSYIKVKQSTVEPQEDRRGTSFNTENIIFLDSPKG